MTHPKRSRKYRHLALQHTVVVTCVRCGFVYFELPNGKAKGSCSLNLFFELYEEV